MNMVNLNKKAEEYAEDLDSTVEWCDSIYESQFSKFFKDQRDLFDRLKSKSRPITDTELEWILTEVPMNLFDAAESLNTLQMKQEIIKLQSKQKESELIKNSKESSDSKKREEASLQTLEDKILLLAYSNIICRVEREMSYSRELIMSAKKIWDGRRNTEKSNPIGDVNPGEDLPEYNATSKNKSYIK